MFFSRFVFFTFFSFIFSFLLFLFFFHLLKMSLPSPAPSYQPEKKFKNKVLLNNSLSSPTALRRVASVPDTKTYFDSQSTHSTPVSPRPSLKPSYSLQKHEVQVGPTDFEKIRLLGKGDVGRVYLVKHKETEKLYALKGKRTNLL